MSGAPDDAQRPRADPRQCGLTDMVKSGWCNADTSEFYPGFPVGPDDTVLDVGCGDGLAVMFSAQRGARVTFCDTDTGKIASLAQRLRERGFERHAGLVTSGDRLPLPDACMTRVIATEVLEHVPDPQAMLREMVRVGRPGALYLVSVPDAAAERFQQPFAHPSYFCAPNHVRIIEPEALERVVQDSGLEVVGRGEWGFYWFLWMCFFWVAQAGPDGGRPTMDQINPPYHPVLEDWAHTWTNFLRLPGAIAMQRELNRLMPKSRVIVARRG
jgi:SAM-dependent methyltransferase